MTLVQDGALIITIPPEVYANINKMGEYVHLPCLPFANEECKL